MGTVFWDFFWAVCLGSAGSGTVLLTTENPVALITVGIPTGILCTAGSLMFALSAILRGISVFF